MQTCQNIRLEKIKEIIEREDEFSFPEFLSLARESIGGKRKIVSKETHISEFTLFKWEHGDFKKPIKTHNLVTISDYYQIPFKLLNKKMKSYLAERDV